MGLLPYTALLINLRMPTRMLTNSVPSFLLAWVSLSLALLTGITGSVMGQSECRPGAIICETFGAGPRGPLPAGQTNFTYRAIACPDDGEYNVMDSVSGSCHGSAWHHVAADHTPNDVRGNMFVVNASYKPSEFYSQVIKGLCPGVTYEFSLWALNLNNELQGGSCDDYSLRNPILVMRIEQTDGTLIDEVVQPAISRTATPVWVQLSMQFMIKTNADGIVVKLINQGLGGCGNDLAIDDISFLPLHPALSIGFLQATGSQTTVCADTPLNLGVGTSIGYPNPAYLWQQSQDTLTWTPVPGFGQTTYTINPVREGRTYYRLRNTQPINEAAIGRNQCSAVSNTLVVDGKPDAPFRLGPDQTLCEGTALLLKVPEPLPVGTTFIWSDGSTTGPLRIKESGDYWLETRLDGCTYRDTIQVQTQNCLIEYVYLPDAFTPNGDSQNDLFVIRHAGEFTTYHFQVFDRWGSLIFSSRQPDTYWDGTYANSPCTNGVYAWTIQYSLQTLLHQERYFTRSGHVTLIR